MSSERYEQYCLEVARRKEINLKHLEAGVDFIDIDRSYIDEDVIIGKGTVVYPGVILEGCTSIGEKCIIGPETRIKDSEIGNRVKVDNSVIIESSIGDETVIGPFAYLRPGSTVGKNVKIGDFVEIKNSKIGDGTKAAHLTYIGDADLGEDINLGCGVVFVNYDGSKKYRSTVEDSAFIGCNVNIVSPVKIEKGAYIAAGTTVTKTVPKGALCVGRAKEINLPDWAERKGKFKKER